MYIVLYRWRIKPELEQQFIESWSVISAYYRNVCGSLGSRLHRGNDGVFYSYAQWKSEEQREKSFSEMPDLPERAKMREAIEKSFPEISLETVSDFLIFSEN